MKPEEAILRRYYIWKVVATKLTQICGEAMRSISDLNEVGECVQNGGNRKRENVF